MSSNSSTNVVSFGSEKMLYDSVQRFAVMNLNDLMRVLMENIDDALFELSDKSKSDTDRNRFFEAMREVRLKQEDIKTSFNEALQKHFSQLIKPKQKTPEITQSNELSLVDQDELEDQLAIDNMVSKAKALYEDELMAIAARLKAILKRKKIKADDNPLDPKSICDSFHQASELLELDIQIKLVIYKLFDKYIISNLGHFYNELNGFLIKKRILVDFNPAEERANQTTQFMANRIRSNPNAKAEQQAYNQALTEQNVQISSANMPHAAPDGSLLALLQRMLNPSAQPSDHQAQDSIPMVDMNLSTGGEPSMSTPSNDLVGLSPSAQNPAYISALTQLQSANLPSVSTQYNADPEALKAQLQQQINTFKQANSEHSTTVDNQIIDIVSMVFDFFFEDENLSNPIKVLIGRLQIPVLKIAIIDSDFFHSKKHPARALLDLISKASLGWDHEHDTVFITKVEQIIETLLNEFDQDITIFEKALDDFRQFLDEQESDSHQHLEAVIQSEEEQDEKINTAQQLAQQFINQLIEQYELSFDIIDFLDGQWKSVVYLTFLSQGFDSPHSKQIRHVTNTLIWSLIVKHTDEDKRKLFKTLPALLRAMSKGMELVHIDENSKNSIFKMLVKEHAKVVKLSNKNIVTRVDDQTVWPQNNSEDAFAKFNKTLKERGAADITLDDIGAEHQENDSISQIHSSETKSLIHDLDKFTHSISQGKFQIDDETISGTSETLQSPIEEGDEDYLDIAQSLEIGTWLEFKESESKVIQAQLSWKSNITGKYVFTDRHGKKVKKTSSTALAIELNSGRAKLKESSSLFERAINSLMDKIGH